MELVIKFGAGFGLGFVSAVSPGPDTVLVLRSSATGGRWAGTRAALGIGCGQVFHALAMVLLVLFLRDIGGSGLLRVIQMVGAGLLIYLGIGMLRSSHAAEPSAAEHARDAKGGRFFWQGFFTNVTNPKAVVFYMSIVSPFVAAGAITDTVGMLAGVVLAVPFWFVSLSVFSAGILVRLKPERKRSIDRVAGLLFIALAVYGIFVTLVP